MVYCMFYTDNVFVLVSGVGLMEIVTEPDMKSGAEAAAFVKEMRQILMAIHTCDGNIQGTCG